MSSPQPGWGTVLLGDIVEVLDRQRIPVSAKERALRLGAVPYYGATGQVGWIDGALFNEPLLLLGEDGVQFFDRSKSKAYCVDGPAWVNNHAHVLRVRHGIADRKFLMHQLNWFDYAGYANGTTRLKLTQAAMRRMPMLLPPLDEQQRIVTILEDHLSRLDAAAQGLAASRSRLTSLRASLFDRAVSVDADGIRLRDLSWDAGYGTSTRCDYGAPGPAVVRIPNLANGAIDLTDEKRSVDPSVDLSDYALAEGDLLIVRTNGSRDLIGRAALVRSGLSAAFASYLIRFRLHPDQVSPDWVWAVLESPRTRQQIQELAASSAGQYNLNLKKLGALIIPVPALAEQTERFASLSKALDDVGRQKLALSDAVRRSDRLRQSLLEAAFSGRLTPLGMEMKEPLVV